MADTTYTVKVAEDIKERLQTLIESSGQSSKDFFADMISQFELANTKKLSPLLSADIDELMNLTTRINHLFVNIGERINGMEASSRLRLEDEVRDRDALLGMLQQQVERLQSDAAQAEEKTKELLIDNAVLKDTLASAEQARQSEAAQLREINQKNNALIEGYDEKIDTLTRLLEEYKPCADENISLMQALKRAQGDAESLRQETTQLSEQLLMLQAEIRTREATSRQAQEQALAYQQRKMELERDQLILEQRMKHNADLEQVREAYMVKINQLLQLNTDNK